MYGSVCRNLERDQRCKNGIGLAKGVESPGIDPGASRMLSERSTI